MHSDTEYRPIIAQQSTDWLVANAQFFSNGYTFLTDLTDLTHL